MKDLINELGQQVKSKKITWQEASNIFNQKMNLNITGEALRKRYSNIKNDYTYENNSNSEYKTIYNNGIIEAQTIVNLSPEEKDNPDSVLMVLGYNPQEWELIQMTFSNWQQHTKEQVTKQLYAVKFKIKPKKKGISLEDSIKIAKELFKKEIKPLKIIQTKINKNNNENKLLELAPIELHLGELSCKIDVGENYDQKIAQSRFRHIIKKVVEKQKYEKCDTLLLSIGSDFFNSDNNFNTTNRGTQQYNDTRWKKMFLIGLKLWEEALITLKDYFNKIDVQLIGGNHDLTTSFYLYMALERSFKNENKINFRKDYKEVQCYVFGKCMIVTTHGDRNVNRTIDSIISEFSKEYGMTKFREIHMEHLHSEQELKERTGIIPRRLGSPKGRGNWEYDERFGNSIQKQEIFIWNKETGLEEIKMISFEPVID